MEPERRSELTARGLRVRTAEGGVEELDLLAGELHYWRVDRDQWRECLRAMKSIGLRVVSTYVPWAVHERAPGYFDWSDNLDLGAFLKAVAREDMRALVRPGPHINAELTGFGFPRRILDADGIRARSARGTPVWLPAPPRMFAVPSYASADFRAEVTAWIEEVGRVVEPHLAPDGPVAAVQVDNEFQLFFRVGAFDHDYHPDALAWWDEFSGGLEPPRAWDAADAGRCALWVRFKEEYTARSLAWLAAALDDYRFAGLARYHNLPPSEPALAPVARAEAAIGGAVGLDFYHRAKDQDTFWPRALFLAGSAAPLPFAPEVGVGGPPWLLPMSDADQRSVTLGLLAAGVRALNFYMAVERERWYGAPITDGGEIRPSGRWLEHLLRALADLDWTGLRRDAPLAVIVSRADARFGIASSLADPLSPVVTELAGLGGDLARDDDARAQRRWLAAILDALDRVGVGYALVDEDCALDRLAGYDAVVMPTLHRVDAALWQRLATLAAGGARVVIGPGKPARDELDEPLATAKVPAGIGRLQPGAIDDTDGLAADLAALVGGAPQTWVAREPRHVRCSLFRDEHGAPAVLFALNRTAAPATAELRVEDGAELADAITGAPVSIDDDGAARLSLAPHEVRMLRIGDGS